MDLIRLSNRMAAICMLVVIAGGFPEGSLSAEKSAAGASVKPVKSAEAVFVKDGRPVLVSSKRGDWKQQADALEAKGVEAALVAGRSISEGDFRITARLTLKNKARSAAAIRLGHSAFGFEGAHGKVFLTGALFDGAHGLPIGDPAKFFSEGEPFTVEIARSGKTLTIHIDDKLVTKRTVTEGRIGPITLLPWRATMQVADFRATGNLSEDMTTPAAPKIVSPPLTTKQLPGVEKTRLLEPGPGNPRNSEGDFIQLKDGRILFIYTHFTGGGSDHAAAHLAGRYSSDGGKTWTQDDQVIVKNEGGFNVMSVSLLRLQTGEIALFYMIKNALTDCRPAMRLSTDEAKTWSEPVMCIEKKGYNVLNNDRAYQLPGGRIILPVSLHNTPEQNRFEGRGIISCYFSDDEGQTWQQSRTAQQGTDVMLQEPGVVLLEDGRLMMFCRTAQGSQYLSYSRDQGDTWTEFQPSNIISPRSPATIERIPATGDLVLIWNDHTDIKPSLKGKRTPFNVAISTDEGRTWTRQKTLEDDPHGWYCYTALTFVDDHILLGHCAGDRRTGGLNTTQITRFSLDWLYDRNAASSQSTTGGEDSGN